MKKHNELNACNALIEILERVTGVKYECESSPDDKNNERPDVDFILKSTSDRSHRIAVEHTIIELFEGQIEYVNRSYDIVEKINSRCRGKIPSDRYYFLTVPHILMSSLKKKRKMAFVDELAPWVVQHAYQLKIDQHLSRIYEVHNIRLSAGDRIRC